MVFDSDLRPLLSAATGEAESDGGWFVLRERLAHLGLVEGFDELICLTHLKGVETFWYQTETVRKVLKQFRGRVLLADEVGLGKTVEAGMVLKEYVLRGMVERVLVLDSRLAGRTMAGGIGDQIRYSVRDHARSAVARGSRAVLGSAAHHRVARALSAQGARRAAASRSRSIW